MRCSRSWAPTSCTVPLIEIAEAPDGGAALAAALERIDTFDWVVVTSRHGAERVADAARALVDPPRRRGDGDGHRPGRAIRTTGRARPERPARDRAGRGVPRRPVVGPRRPSRPRRRHGRRRSASPRLRRRRVHRVLDPLADAERGRRGPRPRRRRGRVRVGFGGRGLGRGDRHAHAADRVRDRPDDRVGRDEIRPQGQHALLPITRCKVSPACSPSCSSAIRRLARHPAPEERHEHPVPPSSPRPHVIGASAICLAAGARRTRALPVAAGGVHRCDLARAACPSVSPATARALTAEGGRPSISGDGRWIVFEGRAAGRVTGDRVSHRPRRRARRSSCRTFPRRCDRATRSRPSSAPMVVSSSSRPSSPSTCSATTTTTSAGTSIASSSPSAAVRPTRGSWCRPRREPGRPVTTSSSPIRRPCRAAARWWRSPTRPRARLTASPRSPSST